MNASDEIPVVVIQVKYAHYSGRFIRINYSFKSIAMFYCNLSRTFICRPILWRNILIEFNSSCCVTSTWCEKRDFLFNFSAANLDKLSFRTKHSLGVCSMINFDQYPQGLNLLSTSVRLCMHGLLD